jgi:outer membrane autotransporter protein
MKRLLLLTAAAAPLLNAGAALAETTVTNARTAPIATASAANGAPDDVTVAQGGSIRLGESGAAITLNSNNKVINRGGIEFTGRNDSVGIAIEGGRTGSVENAGSISLVEDYTPADADKDGDVDGPFAQGSGRFGVRQSGPAGFAGNVTHLRGGAIAVEGNDSGGIVLDGPLTGSLRSAGTVTVTGDNSVGLSAAVIRGDVSVLGAVGVVGENSTAVRLGEVSGRVLLQNGISATGYRSSTRPLDRSVRDKLDADDLKQGGSALVIAGNVTGGVLLDRPPPDTSSTDADEDKDGIPDAEESTASLAAAGSAPALDIGAAGGLRIGVLGSGENAYGLLSRGTITATGVYDGRSATAVRIGHAGGGATVIDGGVRLAAGAIRAEAFEADVAALNLIAGAQTPVVVNERGAAITATGTAEGARTISAVMLEAGASLPLLRNSGEISAALSGETGTASAILDRSGSLGKIENTGVIRAFLTPTDDAEDKDDADNDSSNETVAGRSVAIDLRANRTGTVIVQSGLADGDDGGDNKSDPDADGDGVDDSDEPSIVGDILLGSAADRVELSNGVFRGTIAFGAGEDALIIDGDADVRGRLSDSDGRLAVDMRKGRLELTAAEIVQLSSLNVGADGVLGVTLDPKKTSGVGFQVSGTATLASGADIDVRLTSLLSAPASFRIIDAGAIQAGALDATLAGTPYLYTASLRAAAAEGDLYVDVRRRTAAELGLNLSGAQAYEGVVASLGRDARIERAVLARTDRESLVALYDQLLPDHSGGSIMSAAAISSAVSGAVNAHSGATGTPGATGFWAQQVFFSMEQDREQALGYEAQGFGFAAGIEEVAESDSAVGVSAALVASTYNDQNAALDEEVAMTFVEVGAYGRWVRGPFRADARLGGGYVKFDGSRRVVSVPDTLDLRTEADWSGWLIDAHLGVAYERSLGWLYARPSLMLDYIHLSESEYEESGGGAGVDLAVDSRSGSLVTGAALMALGARFGSGDFHWGPEATVGWRQRLSGEVSETTARFRSGGPAFTLSGEQVSDGGLIARIALKGASGRTAFAIEGGLEGDAAYRQYDLRAVVRFSL